MWTQSSFGTWFVRVHFKNARWSHAQAHGSISARGLRSRSKILPPSAQILIVIGKAFAVHVNARSSNHYPNHVLDHDLKRLSERDSSPSEHSQCQLDLRQGGNQLGHYVTHQQKTYQAVSHCVKKIVEGNDRDLTGEVSNKSLKG